MKDYDVYIMNRKEKILFFGGGYSILFLTGMIFYRNVLLSMACGICIVFFRKMIEDMLVTRRKNRLLLGFRDLMYQVSSSVATGRSMAEALREGYYYLKNIYGDDEDIVSELKILTDGIFENRSAEADLLNDFARRSHLEDIKGFADVYNAAKNTGGNMENVVLKTGNIIMDKISIDREIKTIVSQKKLEAAIIAVMPIAVIAMLNLTASEYILPMYETFAGRMIMTLSLAGISAAYVMIIKITDIKV